MPETTRLWNPDRPDGLMPDMIARLNAALVGRYHVERELGEGGMATVYLAQDVKHERKVALKVLKTAVAALVGAQRFLAEIKTTANLQHPNILPLYDSGNADGFLYYVMPYVKGESLRQRLDREQQLPVDDAVRIAASLAEALDFAHRQGVVHRDVKPANVLMVDGKPAIADFGIALAVGEAGGARLTETGLSLGTPHYMSPEQATGDLTVGPATDIFALGCALYEMLAGEPPFTGSTVQVILGKIITGTPDRVTEVRKSVPHNVAAAISKSLEKLPADRFATAQDFARALADPGFRHTEAAGTAMGGGARTWKWLSLAALSVAVVSTTLAVWAFRRPPAPRSVEVYELAFQEGERPTPGGWDLSADGTTFVYERPAEGGGSELWVRRWDSPEAQPIPGTENAGQPTVSPDGRRLAFVQEGKIKVMAIEGGSPLTVGDGLLPRWGHDDYLYATTPGFVGTLRVPVTGGATETLTEPVAGEGLHQVSDVLPNGWPIVSVAMARNEPPEIRAVDPSTGTATFLVEGTWASYVGTEHLVFVAPDATLMATRLDVRAMEVIGSPVPVYPSVRPGFALSETGKLIYELDPGDSRGLNDELVWMDRSGAVTPVGFHFNRAGVFGFGWSLSPDGGWLAADSHEGGNIDIWLKRLPDGPRERLTSDAGGDYAPWWTTNGQAVTYLAEVDGFRSPWSVRADGSGAPVLLYSEARHFARGVWSPDGEWLALGTSGTGGAADIVALRPGIDSVAIPLVATEFQERLPAFSPDGRWLAYSSNRTGRPEIYVRPFPNVDSARVRISTDGGIAPVWAHSGQELFFRDETNALVSASIQLVPGFRVTGRDTLFTLPPDVYLNEAGHARFYDVTPDDQRFLLGRPIERDEAGATERIFLVNNFFEAVKELVPH